MSRGKRKKRSSTPANPVVPPIETKFIRVLEGWHAVKVEDPFGFGPHECIISPEMKTYRRAYAFERPELVIDAPILPAEHHIRLVRLRHVAIRKLAKKILRERLKRSP